MPAFASKLMLQYVTTLVGGLAGLQQTYIGVPEALASRVSAYVTIGDLSPSERVNQGVWRDPQVLVTFAYRVSGAEATAELQICDLVDALTVAVYADRTLGGTAGKAELDMSMNSQPAYMAVAGSEFRRYLVLISGRQTMSTS